MTDITFPLSGSVINLRVGAIIQYGERVLLCRLPGEHWWYVPGGRIAVGESSLEALSRELSEELQGRWEIGSAIASSENFFELDANTYQEVCLYYSVAWLSNPDRLSALSHEEFRWIARGQLCDYTIKPTFVKSLLMKDDRAMQHIIHRDAEQGAQPGAFGAG